VPRQSDSISQRSGGAIARAGRSQSAGSKRLEAGAPILRVQRCGNQRNPLRVCRLRELQRSGGRVKGNCILLMDELGGGIRTAPGEGCNHFALGCDG